MRRPGNPCFATQPPDLLRGGAMPLEVLLSIPLGNDWTSHIIL